MDGSDPSRSDGFGSADRGTSPVLGVVLLVALTTVLAVVVGGTVLQLPADVGPDSVTPVTLSVTVNATTQTVRFVHEGGRPLDVRTLRIRIAVDGTSLRYQPPVPFFAARGFRAGPTGPFNQAADPMWTTAETTAFRLASTNAPTITPDATVVIDIYQRDTRIARLETMAH
ncbi:MAG: type IV pilin [Halobacteriales archaeon]